MTTKMNQIKQKMKAEYAEKVDQYFAEYEEMKNNNKCDIDGVETLLGNGIAASKDVMIKTMEEIIKHETNVELNADGKKKYVPAEKY